LTPKGDTTEKDREQSSGGLKEEGDETGPHHAFHDSQEGQRGKRGKQSPLKIARRTSNEGDHAVGRKKKGSKGSVLGEYPKQGLEEKSSGVAFTTELRWGPSVKKRRLGRGTSPGKGQEAGVWGKGFPSREKDAQPGDQREKKHRGKMSANNKEGSPKKGRKSVCQ